MAPSDEKDPGRRVPIRTLTFAAKVAASGLAVIALMECALRLFPAVIPVTLLWRFDETLRSAIARRMDLPTKANTVILERDDGGPPLALCKPLARISFHFTDPGVVKTVVMDEGGFCNPPWCRYDVPRIDLITIGDSFTWCTSVAPDQTWTARLAILGGVTAYNLGMKGIGLHEYVQILKARGLAKSPRVVIMNAYEGNDLRDALRFRSHREGKGPGAATQRTAPSSWIAPLRQRSYVLNLLLAVMSSEEPDAQAEDRDPAGPREDFRYSVEGRDGPIPFNPRNVDRGEVVIARKLRAGEARLEELRPPLEEFIRLSQRHRFVPVVAYTPSAHTAYAARVRFEDPSLAELMRWFSAAQREFFDRSGREMGYVFLDLTLPMQEAAGDHIGRDDLLYYQTNLHLTRHGHEVVARALHERLKALGVL